MVPNMDKHEEDDKSVNLPVEPPNGSSHHKTTSNLDATQRPNQRLLQLAELNQAGLISNMPVNSNEMKQSVNKSENVNTPTEDEILDIPPPSYESVVKFEQELNTMHVQNASSNQLPTYQDVGGLSDAPPSYHSIFTETMLRVIHPFNPQAEDRTNRTSQTKFSTIIVNALLFVFITTFVFLLPVSMVTMGIIYIHECPAQPRLPIYLIVLGFFQMLECCGRLAFRLFHQNQTNRQTESWRDRYRRKDPLIYFVIVWFIIGSMWVYQTDPTSLNIISTSIQIHNYNLTHHIRASEGKVILFKNMSMLTPSLPGSMTFPHPIPCNKTIYAFAFWIVTSYYSVIAFFFLLVMFDIVTRVVTRFCCPRRYTRRHIRRSAYP